MIKIYLGLGGNEGPVVANLHEALRELSSYPHITDLKISHFYQTSPHEMNHPQWFVNVVCSFYTDLSPQDLFAFTQAIEGRLGKVNKKKNEGRLIDIDLLFYGENLFKEQFYNERTLQNEILEIPHPRWKERLFVLVPLADLTPEITIKESGEIVTYLLQEMIHSLFITSSQEIYLLEKNSELR